jgi:hypothetical protein
MAATCFHLLQRVVAPTVGADDEAVAVHVVVVAAAVLLELIDEAAYYGNKMLTNFKIFSATNPSNQTSSSKALGECYKMILNIGPRQIMRP